MKGYNNFIGIDIGKLNFVVGVHGSKKTKSMKIVLKVFTVLSKNIAHY